MSEDDLELACARLQRIERDPVFEVVESYEEGRATEFADALLTLQVLVETARGLCDGDLPSSRGERDLVLLASLDAGDRSSPARTYAGSGSSSASVARSSDGL